MEKITPNDIKLFFMWVLHKLNIKHKWTTISYHDKDTNSAKLKDRIWQNKRGEEK